MNIFIDREHAGRFLAEVLRDLRSREQTLVLAIPRGGVVVGKVVAQELHLPLDVISPEKSALRGGQSWLLAQRLPPEELSGTKT